MVFPCKHALKHQWYGESEAAGETAQLMAPLPPSSDTFLPLGPGRMSCCRNNMQ